MAAPVLTSFSDESPPLEDHAVQGAREAGAAEAFRPAGQALEGTVCQLVRPEPGLDLPARPEDEQQERHHRGRGRVAAVWHPQVESRRGATVDVVDLEVVRPSHYVRDGFHTGEWSLGDERLECHDVPDQAEKPRQRLRPGVGEVSFVDAAGVDCPGGIQDQAELELEVGPALPARVLEQLPEVAEPVEESVLAVPLAAHPRASERRISKSQATGSASVDLKESPRSRNT